MSDYPLPSFLAPRADEHEHDEYRYDEYTYDEYEQHSPLEFELRDASGLIRASIITVAVAIGGIALAVSLGHPVRVLADATASLSDNQGTPRSRSAADTAPVQSSADAPPSAQAAGAALTHEESVALAELTSQVRPENEASSGALLEQFQAWAAKQDAEAQFAKAETPAQPAEAAPVQIAQDDSAPEEPVQRHGTTSSLRNARAEMPHVQKPRAKIRRSPSQQAAPIQDARAQQEPVQFAQQPPLMQSFGWNR